MPNEDGDRAQSQGAIGMKSSEYRFGHGLCGDEQSVSFSPGARYGRSQGAERRRHWVNPM